MEINSRTSSGWATDRGTTIQKPGQDMDKNAFLKILAGELANLDPTADIDSTQYVTQLAQFVSMEQMSNLNDTMTMNSYNNLVGKGVTLDAYDSNGTPITGIVAGVTASGSSAIISVEVEGENGKNEYRDYDVSAIRTILTVPDYSLSALSNINGNLSFYFASTLTGKEVELSVKDENDKNIVGKVVEVKKEDGIIKLGIKEEDTDEIKEYTYDKVIKVVEPKLENIS